MSEVNIEGQQELKERPKRVVLEVGVGSHPHYKRHILGEPHFEPKDQYIAFDITQDRLKLLPREPVHRTGKKPDIVRGDALELPFADESVDEIILPDILNSIIVSETDVEKLPDGSKRKQSYDDLNRKHIHHSERKKIDFEMSLRKIIDESIRVLKSHGKIVIVTRLSLEIEFLEFVPYNEVLKYIKSKADLSQWTQEIKPPSPAGSKKQVTILTAIKK